MTNGLDDEEKSFMRQMAKLANEKLEQLCEGAEKCDGAINWADLGVRSVEQIYSLDDYNNEGLFWRINIEEASPDSTDLHDLVRNHVAHGLGFDHDLIEVSTEW